ncbi:MAG: hypothetical protein ACREPY_00205 [Rhodanobacteraceae bacterium]
MNIRIKLLAPLAAALLLVACGGGMRGTYEGGLGTITFQSGKADLTMMGSTVEMGYTTDGDKVVLHPATGVALVLKRNRDGSLETPWGTMKRKD